MEREPTHKTVLLQDAINYLRVGDADIFLDATLGLGGHTLEVFRRFGARVTLVGIDIDEDSLVVARRRIEAVGAKCLTFVMNFSQIGELLQKLDGIVPNRILLDLGWNSFQMEGLGRGLSFQRSEPLNMRYDGADSDSAVTAYDVVNSWEEDSLLAIIRGYGEERYASRIARAIVVGRENTPIATTSDLARIVSEAVPARARHGRIHAATRTFQAIRMVVNGELEELEEGLASAFKIVSSGGTIGVITFHSLEDRIVKHRFREWVSQGLGELIVENGRAFITPSDEEIFNNQRSRSAKMRVIQKN